jgi:hypothetical protein
MSYSDGSLVGRGWTGLLNGVPTVTSSKAYMQGVPSNNHGAATLDDSDNATLVRVLEEYDFSGTGTRAAAVVMLFKPGSGTFGYNGYRVHTDLSGSGSSTTLDASWAVWADNVQVAAGGLTLMDSIRLNGNFSGIFYLEGRVILEPGDSQQRRRFQARLWRNGESVPAWGSAGTLNQLIGSAANGLVGPSGFGNMGPDAGARVRYHSIEVEGNWPLYPTKPIITTPTGPDLVRGVHVLEWAESTDGDSGPGEVVVYDVDSRIDGGLWQPLVSNTALLAENWDLTQYPGSTAQARVRAEDADGLQSDWAEGPVLSIAALVGPTQPVFSIIPDAGLISRGLHQIQWLASNDSDALPATVIEYELELSVNGAAWQGLSSLTLLTYYLDTDALAGSQIQIRLRSVDHDYLASIWSYGPVWEVDLWASCDSPEIVTFSACDEDEEPIWTECED